MEEICEMEFDKHKDILNHQALGKRGQAVNF